MTSATNATFSTPLSSQEPRLGPSLNGHAPTPSSVPQVGPPQRDIFTRNIERAKAHVHATVVETRDAMVRTWRNDTVRLTRTWVAGIAVTLGTSLGIAFGLGNNLLRLAEASESQRQLLTSIPIVGAFAKELLGPAGALGSLAVAAPLLTLTSALVESEGRATDRVHWTLTHMALGLALAPLWLIPAGAAGAAAPALAAAAAAMAGISLVVGVRLNSGTASWRMAIAGATAVIAGCPLPAMVATGTAGIVVLAYAATMTAIGSVTMAAYLLATSRAALTDDSTALIRGMFHREDTSGYRLNLPDERRPTVFCFNPQLTRTVSFLRNSVEQRLPLGIRPMMLSGPPGTGKSIISVAIANALRASAATVSPAAILSAENPAAKLREVFEQAALLQGPIVLFFSDAESLFADREQADSDAEKTRRTLMTTTLNECLDGVQKNSDKSIVVVLSTNNPAFLDASFESRFAATDCFIDYPTREQQAQILQSVHATEFGENQLNKIRSQFASLMDAKDIQFILNQFPKNFGNISGRELRDVSRNAVQVVADAMYDKNFISTAEARQILRRSYAHAIDELIERRARAERNKAAFRRQRDLGTQGA